MIFSAGTASTRRTAWPEDGRALTATTVFAVPRLPSHAGGMHKTAGVRDPAAAFPLPSTRDDRQERREANRAIAVSAVGLAATGLVELLLAILTGSVGLLGDAIHNLSDVSTSAVVFLGFRLSRKGPTERYPYGLDRAEDLAGVGIAIVIWASAAFAGYESIRKLARSRQHQPRRPRHRRRGAGHHREPGRRPVQAHRGQAHQLRDADRRCPALLARCPVFSGALAGLVAVSLGFRLGDPIAGMAVTLFICHVGYEVTKDVVQRLADGVDPAVITAAEAAAGSVRRSIHAHARARWTGRTLRIEIEGWVDPDMSVRDADELGRQVAAAVADEVPEGGSFTWTTRAGPAQGERMEQEQARSVRA